MTTGTLTIDLPAIRANWRALSGVAGFPAGAVVKADAYGLGVPAVVPALWEAGARDFYVAVASEGAAVRSAAPEARIFVFSGHMDGDAGAIREHGLIALLNSPEQWRRHRDTGLPYGVQVDTGMARLGMQPADWSALRGEMDPVLVMSHLACADEPDHPQNAAQLRAFREMTDGSVPRSLAATGGTLLGPDYAFDAVRPGIGLYGGAPFAKAAPVVRLSLPVVQIRTISTGASVGYGASWTAQRETRVATLSGGYADGLIRAMSNGATLWHDETPCPLIGRVSMDLLTVDITDANGEPDALDIICPEQGIDALADAAGTIGYEILTSLGNRYSRAIVA